MTQTQYPLTRFDPTEQHLISAAIIALACFAGTFLTEGSTIGATVAVSGIILGAAVRLTLTSRTNTTDRAANRVALGGAILGVVTGGIITTTGVVLPVLASISVFVILATIQLYFHF